MKKSVDEIAKESFANSNNVGEFLANFLIISSAQSEPKDRSGYVYAIGWARSKYIKIGFSKEPEARLKRLQNASPRRLKLERKLWKENSFKTERELHMQLRPFRSPTDGEWFERAAALEAFDQLTEDAPEGN